jgi:transposase InsO family protein
VNPLPERIQVGNGSEFISKDLDRRAYENKVTLDYSSPGKPTDNPFIESFNGIFRDECLNVNNTVYSSLELGMAMETRMQEAKVIFSWWCRVSF